MISLIRETQIINKEKIEEIIESREVELSQMGRVSRDERTGKGMKKELRCSVYMPQLITRNVSIMPLKHALIQKITKSTIIWKGNRQNYPYIQLI